MSETGKQRILAGGIIAAAVVGIAVTGTLLSDHDGGWDAGHNLGTAFLLQLCSSDAMPSASCADVVASRWGSFDVYVGTRRILVPMSFIGLAYFLTVVIWISFCGLPPPRAKWRRRGVMLFATCGVLVSIWLTGVMVASLHAWCPLCVIAHGANVAILAGLVLAMRVGRCASMARIAGVRRTRHHPDLRLGLLALGTIVAAIAVSWLHFDTVIEARRQWRRASGLKHAIEAIQGDAAFTIREFFAEPVRKVPLHDTPPDDARPTMVVFRSFESDASACFEQDWRDEFSQYAGGAMRIEYRQTPLELIRAIEAGRPIDDTQTATLRAMEAARLQRNPPGYDRLAVALFRSRKRTGTADVADLATRAGLDADRLVRDMDNDSVRRTVMQDLSLAAALGIDHTPAIFIEGRRVPNLCVKSTAFWAAIANQPGLAASFVSLDRTWTDGAGRHTTTSDVTK